MEIWKKSNKKLLGFVPIIGESSVCPGYIHDDQGITPWKAGQLAKKSNINAIFVSAPEWCYIQPEKGQDINWTAINAYVNPLLVEGVEPFAYISYYKWPQWVDQEIKKGNMNFWQYADEFMKKLVEYYTNKNIHYYIFENEPNMYGKQDWYIEYMEHLKHGYKVIKSVSKNNKIIAGNLSEQAGKPDGSWEILYRNGFKNFSDIVGYHPYSNDPKTGINIIDAAEAHSIMEKYGDGDKPMFFGEGWGPKRFLKNVRRISPNEEISREEIEVLNQFIYNGYKNLMSKTETWDPDWFIGAFFFTLNDNWGKRYWKDRAQYVDNDGDGVADTWYVDNVWMGSEVDLNPEFFNGGLVDIYGKSKDGLLESFFKGRKILR